MFCIHFEGLIVLNSNILYGMFCIEYEMPIELLFICKIVHFILYRETHLFLSKPRADF